MDCFLLEHYITDFIGLESKTSKKAQLEVSKTKFSFFFLFM